MKRKCIYFLFPFPGLPPSLSHTHAQWQGHYIRPIFWAVRVDEVQMYLLFLFLFLSLSLSLVSLSRPPPLLSLSLAHNGRDITYGQYFGQYEWMKRKFIGDSEAGTTKAVSCALAV